MDNTSTAPDLVANTGINDPSSVWYTGLLQTAVGTGTTLLGQALGAQSPVAQNNGSPGTSKPSPLPAAHSSTTTYVLIGAAALVLGWLMLRD